MVTSSVTDVAFLRNPDVSGPIVYRYRTKILASRVRRTIESGLAANGGGLAATDEDRLLSDVMSQSLFADAYAAFIEWPLTSTPARARLADSFCAALETGLKKPAVIFARHDTGLFKSAGWAAASHGCIFIDEAVVTPETYQSVLDYYWTASDLPFRPSRSAKWTIREDLIAHGFDRNNPSLPDFFRGVDRRLLLAYDEHTKSFLRDEEQRENEERSYILRPIRGLLARVPGSANELISGLEVKFRRQGHSSDEIVCQVCNLTCDLLTEVRAIDGNEPFGGSPGAAAILWAIALLVELPRIASAARTKTETLSELPDTFLADFRLLCSDFERRRDGRPDRSPNPLSEWWHVLDAMLERFAARRDLPLTDEDPSYRGPAPLTSEERVMTALFGCLNRIKEGHSHPIWIERLLARTLPVAAKRNAPVLKMRTRAQTGRRSRRISLPNPSDNRSTPAFPPQTLADIIGHRGAAARMRRRFYDNAHELPLLLYGPPGVGKMAMARLYAKALICETSRSDPSLPCNDRKCHSCQEFYKREPALFDLYFMDAAIHDDADPCLAFLHTAPKGARNVAIINNFDHASAGFVDALLKEMEKDNEGSGNEPAFAPRTIILLATNLTGVREAGSSRCAVERLAPLIEPDLTEFCRTVVGSRNIVVAGNAIKTLAIASRGVPRLIANSVLQFETAGVLTPEYLRQACNIDWAEMNLQFWRDLFSAKPRDVEKVLTDLNTQIVVGARFVFAELLGLLISGIFGVSCEPAMLVADRRSIESTRDAVVDAAKNAGIAPESMLAAIADIFSQDSFTGPGDAAVFQAHVRHYLRQLLATGERPKG